MASTTERGSDVDLWITADGARFFLVPRGRALPQGSDEIRRITGQRARVDLAQLGSNEITEAQARRWAKDELGQALEELRQSADEKLAQLRQKLDEFNKHPIEPGKPGTRDAPGALLEVLRQLPGVIGKSLSGEAGKVDAAREAMEALQARLREAGLDLDDRFTRFPERLASIRREAEAERAAERGEDATPKGGNPKDG